MIFRISGRATTQFTQGNVKISNTKVVLLHSEKEMIQAPDSPSLPTTFLETFDSSWPESLFHSGGGHLGLKYKAKSN